MSNKTTVIWLYNSRLKAVEARLDKDSYQVKVETEQSFSSHSFDELAHAFKVVKKELRTEAIRLMLPEEKTFLRVITFPLSMGLNRELVRQKAQEVLPENIKEGYFDWREAGETATEKLVQVFAASQVYLNFVRSAAKQAGLEIESFESPSLAVARLLAQKETPVAAVLPADGIIICVCYQGAVYQSVVLEDQSDLETKLNGLKGEVKKQLGRDVAETIREGLDPIRGALMKEDLRGEDEAVLNLPSRQPEEINTNSISAQEEQPMEAEQTNDPEVKLRSLVTPVPGRGTKKGFLWGILAVVILVAIGGGVYFFTRNREGSEPEVTIAPTAAILPTFPPTGTPEASPTPKLDRADLQIRILNGSGEPGGAGQVQEYLEGLGYEVVSVGNADNFNYDQTQVSLKEELLSFSDLLISDLAEEYEVSTGVGVVEPEEEYEALVILGRSE